jgi:hypothetical protein
MGLEIVWSKNASKTLELAHKQYSEIVGSSNSQLFIESLIEKVNQLQFTPNIGKSIKFNNSKFNYFIHSHYKIIYQIKPIKNIEKIFVLLIFDTRQNPNKLTEQLKSL